MKKVTMMISLVGILAFSIVPAAADYIGSDKCFECHQEQYNYWQASGHPWKLRTADKARYAKLPLPPGYGWDDISYVIGGANWKARFINKEGYIITTAKNGSEAKTQYNLEDGAGHSTTRGRRNHTNAVPAI